VIEAEQLVAEAEPALTEAEPPAAEPEPVLEGTEPELTAFDEPTEPPAPTPPPEPEPEPDLEPAASRTEVPAPEPPSEVEPESQPVTEPEPEPELEPAASAATSQTGVETAGQLDPDVRSTLVAWPSGSPAAASGNGARTDTGSFEEATSVIPAWQQTDPNADPRRTVSLQAMPPEQIASGSGFAALLTFESGPFSGRVVALPNQMVSIGRAPDNDVVVGDPATSGHHGRIEVRYGSFWISDLGSTNGTQVNGEPVIEKQLSDGDLIAIGQNALRFTLEA
jgi:hypothetical protein